MAVETKWVAFMVDSKTKQVARARVIPDIPRVIQQKHDAGFVEVTVDDETGLNPKFKAPLVADPKQGGSGS